MCEHGGLSSHPMGHVVHQYFRRLTLVLEAAGSWELSVELPRPEGRQRSARGQDGYRSVLQPQLLLALNMLWTSPEHQDNLFQPLCSSLCTKPCARGARFAVPARRWLCAVCGGLSFHHLTHRSKKNKEVRNIITVDLFWMNFVQD